MKVNETLEISDLKNSLQSYLDICKEVVLYLLEIHKDLEERQRSESEHAHGTW